MQEAKCKFSVLHFNDVYDLQPEQKEPVGGAAYFKTLLDRYRREDTLTFFSGDVFSPSLLSTEYKGVNMVKPLNSFKIDVACLGNHDLDYSLEQLTKLKEMTKFPWLLSNIYDKRTKKLLGDAEEYKIIQKGGLKIGIFSLAEKQWIDTLMPQYISICDYFPFIDCAEHMIRFLKGDHKCDIIIALTHMMKYNDIELAKNCPQIDFIFGGHDHLVVHELVNNTIMIKSGTNFRHFSFAALYQKENLPNAIGQNQIILQNSKWGLVLELIQVNHQKMQIVPDPELNSYIQQIYQQFAHIQERVVLYTKQPIDLRFKTIRKQQISFLEFIVSIYRHHSRSDCAFMNAGNFRMDCFIEPGPITYGTLTNMIEDTIVTKKVLGEKIVAGLENCVAMYPNLSGRFCAFSGLSFTWDSRKKPKERILKETIKINGETIDLTKIYRVAMHNFVSEGGDGFSCFTDCEVCPEHPQKKNIVLVHEFLEMDKNLMEGFEEKYPNIYKIIEYEGHEIIELNLLPPKNVHMLAQNDE